MSPDRWAQAPPLLVACLLFAAVSGAQGYAIAVAALILLSLAIPRCPSLSVSAQVLLAMASSGLAVVLIAVLPLGEGIARQPLRPFVFSAAACILMVATTRLYLRAPERGAPGTLGIALLVFAACGSTNSGAIYPLLLLAYLCLAFAAISLADRARNTWARLGRRHHLAFALLLALACAFSGGLAHSLPRLYDHANSWALNWLAPSLHTGFHDGPIQMGSMDGMFQSDELVLRVRGEGVKLLRGNVYRRYLKGRWHSMLDASTRPLHVQGPAEESSIELDFLPSSRERFFLPSQVEILRLEPHTALVDDMAVVRTQRGESPLRAWIRPGKDPRLIASTPGALELEIPTAIEAELAALVESWAAPGLAPEQALAAIRSRLETDYRYGLEFERGGPGDPVIEFLGAGGVGHCEYFASAMALLARAAGIPSRLVTGYAVVEKNELGDYYLVRERHAHAWVEAYLPTQGWTSIDPSPRVGYEGIDWSSTPWLSAVTDYARLMWSERQRPILLTALVVLLAGIQVRRILVTKSPVRTPPKAAKSQPPGYLAQLLNHLAQRGHARAPGETLESYAGRFPNADASDPASRLAGARVLLLRYAALRYGDRGDPQQLHAEVQRWLGEHEAKLG